MYKLFKLSEYSKYYFININRKTKMKLKMLSTKIKKKNKVIYGKYLTGYIILIQ